MSSYVCDGCGEGMTRDEAALNYKYVHRQCTTFLCPSCLGERLGLSADTLRGMIRVFQRQGCTLFSIPDEASGTDSK